MFNRSLYGLLVGGLLLPTLAPAQTPSTPTTQRALEAYVTPEGAFFRPIAAGPAAGGAIAQTGNLLWTHTSGGLNWIGENVSIGNQGSEVFTEYSLNNEAAALFSSNDTNPPTPLWTDSSALNAENQNVASGDGGSVHVAFHRLAGQMVLNKYSNASAGTPDWSYTFAASTNGGTNVGVSRDGQTIVALVTDNVNWNVEIAVFSPASNVPISFTQVPVAVNGYVRGFDLSADGSTLYFSSGVIAHIFDIASQTVVFTSNIGASFDSHAISGDGSVFAYGNFGLMRVFEKIGGTYVNTFNRSMPGQNYVAEIDISDDSSTIAYGFTFYAQYLQIQVEAIDVASQAVIMTDVAVGTGGSQNIVSGVSISADGSRFVVGAWGDAGGLVEEMRMYSRNQNAPIATVNLPGSIFGIAISADGTKMAGASKAVHANTFGNGGRIDLWGKSHFPTFCAGDGSQITACPCGNTGTAGRGCNNSIGTGGAFLSGNGMTSPDTVVLTSAGELPTALSIFLQGDANIVGGVVFGDGVRCAGGNLKRLYVKNASGGIVSAPAPGDPSITAQSAALGDTIPPGGTRYYQTYYRDPDLAFCPDPQGNSWNVSNGVEIVW